MISLVGSKNKLRRFRENQSFKNVIEPGRDEVLKGQADLCGNWQERFGNKNPIVLELGCGKGEYTIGLAERNPDKNYIGIDIKGARLWRGAKTATENHMKNVLFLRTQIELVDRLFAENEIAEIWITFPDPQIKYKRTKHRMTNIDFLKKYHHIMSDQGVVHLKTDSEFLHGYTIGLLQGLGHEILYANHDVYRNEGSPDEVLEIQTFYESRYLESGKPITYLRFRIN
jgi:tRNA (guanine-N7-)-methyltransferase